MLRLRTTLKIGGFAPKRCVFVWQNLAFSSDFEWKWRFLTVTMWKKRRFCRQLRGKIRILRRHLVKILLVWLLVVKMQLVWILGMKILPEFWIKTKNKALGLENVAIWTPSRGLFRCAPCFLQALFAHYVRGLALFDLKDPRQNGWKELWGM